MARKSGRHCLSEDDFHPVHLKSDNNPFPKISRLIPVKDCTLYSMTGITGRWFGNVFRQVTVFARRINSSSQRSIAICLQVLSLKDADFKFWKISCHWHL